jgi:predicted branched-subunit amino acid permease
MSATTFAGSAQFAVSSILGNAGSAAAAIAAPAMLNARYAPIGISVAPAFDGDIVKRLLQAQLIVAESWAIALKRREGFDVRVLLGAGGLLYVCRNGGTALGVILGDAIGDPNRGPVLLGRRELPAWPAGPVSVLAPAVLAALVVTQTVGGHRALVADARLVGLGVGALAVALRAPLLVVLVAAAAAAALVRLL